MEESIVCDVAAHGTQTTSKKVEKNEKKKLTSESVSGNIKKLARESGGPKGQEPRKLHRQEIKSNRTKRLRYIVQNVSTGLNMQRTCKAPTISKEQNFGMRKSKVASEMS